ncbi:FKBP-type peptidyl-prolyl cis-trans isomerase [Mucilaginibacter agri]|uniref:Peptidyl-prolyl cis-trans isomerase n=1 Tax=Mucilaginibacter agri TaxID=2695265 RepID=A0A965ZEJ1_9SPHI|nr:FKBP-type peptidyl-prolyl cis-trans isomerase [Mucilaginibacter agri]NCD69604.1 FKBP-type peptidylprolyl isomerase [Mucilaginibacter agri]
MKKYLFLLLTAVVGLASCSKKDDSTTSTYDATAQAAKDDATIQAFIKTNNITAVKDPSGVYYQVVIAGDGAYPTATSTVTVNYKGYLLDGTLFDSGSSSTFSLTSVIAGWQYGIPHINKGGRIRLLIPSTLAYKNTASGKIPANSVLDFTVDLIKF